MFFFYSYRNHRDLHSFPTRRSSDLDGSDAKWKVEGGVITVVKGTGDITTRQKFGDYQLHVEWKVPEDIQGQRDRKSTRLNSSHGYISYAVFCLKKKKKQRITDTSNA